MTYCDETIGSGVKLGEFTEEQILVAIWPPIMQLLPELVAADHHYKRLQPQLIANATTLADVFAGFHLEILRNEASEPAAINSTFDPWVDAGPLLRQIAPYLARGSWYAVTDDNRNSGVYIVDPTAPNSLRSVKFNVDENPLWVVPVSEYQNGYGHNYWYASLFPEGPPFGPEAPYHVKLTELVRTATKCDWLLPCFAGGNWG